MIVKFDKSGTVSGFSEIFNSTSKDKNVKSIIILSGNNEEFTPNKIDPILQKSELPIVGGLFSSIIYDSELYSKGTIIIGLQKTLDAFTVPRLSDKNYDYDEVLEAFADSSSNSNNETMFVFVDGYSTQVSKLVESLFNTFGLNNNFIGGGAGYYHPKHDMKSKPCIFTNKGLVADCAILGWAKLNSKVSVKHGWKKIGGPFRVNEVEGKSIKSIDWNSAFDYYTSIISKHSGKRVTLENFFEIGEKYSLGIQRIGSDVVVREPIATDGKSLIFTVPIPNESLVYILTGEEKSMVDAAYEAKHDSTQNLSKDDKNAIFIIDCISRYYFLKDNFKNELKSLSHDDIPMFGGLTIGEIANTGKHYIEVYNKTCVTGLIND